MCRMPASEVYVEIIATQAFEASAKKLLTEEDRRQLELLLVADRDEGEWSSEPEAFAKCGLPGRAVRRARAGARG